MINGSYVAKGYKYGIIAHPDMLQPDIKQRIDANVSQNQWPRDMEVSFPISTSKLIPFDCVDGLTSKEIADFPNDNVLYKRGFILFAMYDSIKSAQPSIDTSVIRCIYPINVRQTYNYPIDELLENHYLKTLLRLTQPNRKRALGFLEEYIYHNAANVDSKIRVLFQNGSTDRYTPATQYTKLDKRLIDR